MSFEQRAVILQHKNEKICKESTSGGAFTAIAEYVISREGIVFGVAFDDELRVKHISVENPKELYKFRNSKYVQSYVGDSYKMVKRELEKNRLVCFSGTPCQIEGLRSFLARDYDNLILVDVVCRAVPSPGVWEKYVEMEKKKWGSIASVRFRDKTLGYQFSTMEIKNNEGIITRGSIDTQPWLRMFFSGMIIRPSCTNCCFRGSQRNSDFTIWDCFNSYKFDTSFDESKGTTRMLIHSAKGMEVFNEIKKEFQYREIDPLIAVQAVQEMKKSPGFNPKREEFFNDYKNMEMQKLINKYFPITIKLRIKNYTRRVLNALGLDVVIKRVISH